MPKLEKLTYGMLNEDMINQIAELLSEGFIHDSLDIWKKRLAFSWLANPFIEKDMVIGWLLRDDNQCLAGIVGWIPVFFEYNGVPIKVCATSAWYVRADIQGALSASMIQKYNMLKDTDGWLCTTPSPIVTKMLSAMKFIKIGNPEITNYIIPTNLKKFSNFASDLLERFSERYGGARKFTLHSLSRVAHLGSLIIPTRNNTIVVNRKEGLFEIRMATSARDIMNCLKRHPSKECIQFSKDEKTLSWIFLSKEVNDLLSRKIEFIYTHSGEYVGYFVYDIQEVGPEKIIRIREFKLLNPEDSVVRFVLDFLKCDSKKNNCSAIYFGLLGLDEKINSLLRRHILLSLKTENRYFLKFRKELLRDVDLYSICVPSDLDPDAGFL